MTTTKRLMRSGVRDVIAKEHASMFKPRHIALVADTIHDNDRYINIKTMDKIIIHKGEDVKFDGLNYVVYGFLPECMEYEDGKEYSASASWEYIYTEIGEDVIKKDKHPILSVKCETCNTWHKDGE